MEGVGWLQAVIQQIGMPHPIRKPSGEKGNLWEGGGPFLISERTQCDFTSVPHLGMLSVRWIHDRVKYVGILPSHALFSQITVQITAQVTEWSEAFRRP